MNKLISISNTILSNNTGLDAITRAPIVEYKTPYRCLRIQNVSHEENFEKWGYTEVSKDNYINFQLHKDDIIISRTGGSIGTLMYIDKDYPAVYNNGLIRLVVNKEKYNPLYIYYCLKLNAFNKHIEKCSLGNSTQENIRMNEMLEYKIPNYSLDIQDKIVSILNVLDRRINNNKIINAELEAMAKTIYDYWFLQFDFPDDNGKPYKSSGGKMVWNEELKKEIPEGWEVKKVQDILGKIHTTKKYKSDEYGKGNKYPIIDQSSKYICGYTDDENELLNLEDCIVFGDHTKNVKYVNFAFARGADGTQVINSSSSSLPNYILYRQILDMDLVSQGYSRYFKFLKDKHVIVPQKNVSDGFIKGINDSLSKMKHIINENKELESLRDFLLPLLMNGQVGFKQQSEHKTFF